MEYFLQGMGHKGTWYWHSIESNYEFLDNQFLLLAWWAACHPYLSCSVNKIDVCKKRNPPFSGY